MPPDLLPPRPLLDPWVTTGWAVPLARRLSAGDAASWFEHLQDQHYPFLLESARPHPIAGRYSFLGCDPAVVVRAKGRAVEVGRRGAWSAVEAHPLEVLRALLAAPPTISVEGLPPFVGGAVGLLGYDLARLMERLPAQAVDDLGLPDLVVGIYETVVALDHRDGAAWIITRVLPGQVPQRAYEEAVARLETMARRLEETGGGWDGRDDGAAEPVVAEMPQARFEAMVREAQRWIAAGEIYQANLSQRFRAPRTASPWSLYRRLRAVNPSPFAGYFDAGDFQLVCGSPERLVRLAGGVVETRPIAGTRPRTGRPDEDRAQRAELIAHPKERAEHLMLVDLERNDLGRVCAYGSVEVSELMALEAYSHVFHIVSNVRGRVRPDRAWTDVLAAMFPGGTITGCPKLRAIECIDALEPVRRQFYTGSLGYVSFTGAMDWNLIIRSALVTPPPAVGPPGRPTGPAAFGGTAGGGITRGAVYVQVGAGIVADSDPAREYEETWHKAQAMLLALQGEPPVPTMEGRHAVAVG